MTTEQKLSTDDLYKRARWFGWTALAANSALLLWNLARLNWNHLILNAMGLFFVWWTFKIIEIQRRGQSKRVVELCDSVDTLLTNLADAGEYEAAEDHGPRPDINRVERALALVRAEGR